MTRSHLVVGRAALAGAATGLRSTVGLAALIDAGTAGLPALLTRPRARAAARLGVASELVVDKLPSTPSRLEPAGLAGRIVFAAMTGAVLARGANQPVLEAVVIASAAAIAGAKLGHDARAAAAEIFPSFAVAGRRGRACGGLAAASSPDDDDAGRPALWSWRRRAVGARPPARGAVDDAEQRPDRELDPAASDARTRAPRRLLRREAAKSVVARVASRINWLVSSGSEDFVKSHEPCDDSSHGSTRTFPDSQEGEVEHVQDSPDHRR